jgi:hypothetical protein
VGATDEKPPEPVLACAASAVPVNNGAAGALNPIFIK